MEIEMTREEWVKVCEILRKWENMEHERIRLSVSRDYSAMKDDIAIIDKLENHVISQK